VILALSVTYWPWFARLVYAETRALQKEIFVESTAALGAGPARLIGLHVLPNIAAPLMVQTTLALSTAILTEASLSFLGVGAQPPTPSWGCSPVSTAARSTRSSRGSPT
jgi:peptide/nickel transport system permease protein